jgi:hypothetical protein
MRETCARVLAAALLTGAIATVVGMAAHLGPPSRPDRPIAAPPSSLQRAVRLTAEPVPKRRTPARLVTTHTIRTQARPETLTRNLVVFQRRHHPHLPTATRQLAATEITSAPPDPVQLPATDAQPTDQEHGHGHAYGRGKQDE